MDGYISEKYKLYEYKYIHLIFLKIYTACVYIYIYINKYKKYTIIYILYKNKTFILDGINRSIALEKTPN